MMDDDDLPAVGEIETPKGVHNAGSRAAVRQREKDAEMRDLGKTEAMRELLAKRYGRALLFDTLRAAGFWDTGVNPSYNSNEMWARIGARQVALELNALAWRCDSGACKLMMDENPL